MSEPIDTLVKRAEYLFGKRRSILPFWQEISENFLPMRAQFTRQFYLSEQFADRVLTSYPLMVQRDLANALSAMLRPREQDWFAAKVEGWESLDRASKAWLEWATGVQKRAMYERHSQFVRATREGDQDYSAFGQCAISREMDMAERRLLYRCWHLKDTVWAEGYNGTINEIYRNWNPTRRDLCKLFPKTVSANVKSKLEQDPHVEVRCMHVVLPGEDYDRIPEPGQEKATKYRTPWASCYIDIENKVVLQENASYSRIYTLPRWATVSGSAIAYSPAAVAGLPDGRLLQAMTLTLMEAGEMAVRPPLVAAQDVVRSDVSIYAGGITWVDAEYDERLGEALRPLITSSGEGLKHGFEMIKDAREMLAEAFYLNKLALPPPDREMTAYETGQRLQEWIRQALPLFEPMEVEYNAALCDDTFEALMRVGAFGSPADIPQPLRGKEVKFSFESPLHQATQRKKGALFLQAGQMITEAMQLDPNTGFQVDATTALRDALEGIGVPQEWMRDAKLAAQLSAQREQQQAIAAAQSRVLATGQAVQALGAGAQSLAGTSQ